MQLVGENPGKDGDNEEAEQGFFLFADRADFFQAFFGDGGVIDFFQLRRVEDVHD